MHKFLITSFMNAAGETCGIFENEEMTKYFVRFPNSSIDAEFSNNYTVIINYVKSRGFTQEV